MTREEAITALGDRNNLLWGMSKEEKKYYSEALEMAISALSEELSEDGTLTVHVSDGSKVKRVFVMGDNIFGGLYYPDSAENKGEWIPVSERLPKERQAVLCWAESTAERLDAEFIGQYDNGDWFLQSDANHLSYPHQYNVVAWQPLPEPYKKEGE